MPASGTPWLRINRVLRLMPHTAEAWSMMARQGYDRQSAAAIIHHVQGVGSHAEAAGGYRAARAQKRSPREAARFRRAE